MEQVSPLTSLVTSNYTKEEEAWRGWGGRKRRKEEGGRRGEEQRGGEERRVKRETQISEPRALGRGDWGQDEGHPGQ